MPKSIRRFGAIAAIVALALALPATGARADVPGSDVPEGPRLLLKYATCVLAVAAADTPAAAFGAFLVCGKIFLDEFPK